jgi:hypothetical protein
MGPGRRKTCIQVRGTNSVRLERRSRAQAQQYGPVNNSGVPSKEEEIQTKLNSSKNEMKARGLIKLKGGTKGKERQSIEIK